MRNFQAYLLPDHQQKLQKLRAGNESRLVFSRFTILYVMKQACLVCPEQGGQVDTRRAHSELGLCCLMANDLFFL